MIKVLVVDDHVVVAEALESTLGSVEGLQVVATARTGAEGLALALSLRPDVALIDFRLPDISGADVVRRLRAEAPEIRCVVLTGTGMERAMLDAIDAGAVGFVTKDQRFGEVVDAVFAAAAGEATFPPDLLARVLPELSRGTDGGTRLTRRERDVLELMANGRSNAEIGQALFISTNTVRNHVANLLAKLGARSRGEAVAIAVREGLVVVGSSAVRSRDA